jgi:hypothetical protein
MVKTLDDLEEEVASAFEERSKRFVRASLFIKGVVIAGGAAAATIAQFMMDMPDSPTGVPWSRIIGIGSSIIVFIGGLILAVTETDASEELQKAREAILTARSVLSQNSRLLQFRRRYQNLIAANEAQRTWADFSHSRLRQTGTSEEDTVKEMLEDTGHSLSISCGFEQNDIWSIAIQRPVDENGTKVLRPIAHKRAVDCSLDKARSWPSDVGISARCFQTRTPVLVGDMKDPAVQSALGTQSVQPDVYRSIYAHPIILQDEDECWGVLIATSNVRNHFSKSQLPSEEHHSSLAQFVTMAQLALGIRRMSEELEKTSDAPKPSVD